MQGEGAGKEGGPQTGFQSSEILLSPQEEPQKAWAEVPQADVARLGVSLILAHFRILSVCLVAFLPPSSIVKRIYCRRTCVGLNSSNWLEWTGTDSPASTYFLIQRPNSVEQQGQNMAKQSQNPNGKSLQTRAAFHVVTVQSLNCRP